MNDLMTRRAAIARVAYLLGGAVSASTVAGVLAGCDRGAGTNAAVSALSPEQKELVATLADHILPETDTPGAGAVGVQDFIDAMMTDFYPAEERDRFLAGLGRVDQRAERAFGARFIDAPAEQQLRLVEALNRQAFPDAEVREPAPSPEPILREGETARTGDVAAQDASRAEAVDQDWDPEDVGRQAFFRRLKELVLIGYYTSEEGATQELHMPPLGIWRADIPYSEVGRAWA